MSNFLICTADSILRVIQKRNQRRCCKKFNWKIFINNKTNRATAVTVAESEENMKTILDLAKENNINKVCIDGDICDIRQLNKQPFKVVPRKTNIMKNTIFNEPMLFAWTK